MLGYLYLSNSRRNWIGIRLSLIALLTFLSFQLPQYNRSFLTNLGFVAKLSSRASGAGALDRECHGRDLAGGRADQPASNGAEAHLLALTTSSAFDAATYYLDAFHRRGDYSAGFLAGNLYQYCGDRLAALAAWRQVALIDQYFLRQYRDAVRTGNLRDAVSPLVTLTELFPYLPTYWKHLGDTYVSLDEYDQAMASYSNAVSLDPDNPRYHYDLGMLHIRLHREQEAIANLSMAATSDALESRVRFFAYIGVGGAYYRLGQFLEACQSVGSAIAVADKRTNAAENMMTGIEGNTTQDQTVDAAGNARIDNRELCKLHWVAQSCDPDTAQRHARYCSQ